MRLRFTVSNLYISSVSHLETLFVFSCIESMQSDDNTSRINRACCVSTSTIKQRFTSQTAGPLSVAGESREQKTCKLIGRFVASTKSHPITAETDQIYRNKSDRHSGGSKSIRATDKTPDL